MIANLPLRIAVTGITGRMGKEVLRCIVQRQYQQKIILGAAITRFNSGLCGMDAGEFLKSSRTGVIITDSIELVKENFDVLIDFTSPEATMEYLRFCSENSKNMIIGTTGLNLTFHHLIQDASKKIGIVYSANFSIGMTVMLKLLKEITSIISNFVDIDIIEIHHNKKQDIPSGTALMMRDVFKKNKPETNLVNNIKIHSIRSGDIVGEHTVLFSRIGECLKITHQAFNRIIFVDGAIIAAMWIGASKVGLFDLNDVLKNNISNI